MLFATVPWFQKFSSGVKLKEEQRREQMSGSVFICIQEGGVSVGKLLSTVGINVREISSWCGLGQPWMKTVLV